MTNEKLYEVLGDINEKHVYEARAYHKAKKSIWAKWGVMAACLCLIVAGTVAMLHQPKYDTMTGDPIKDAGGGISGVVIALQYFQILKAKIPLKLRK